MLDLFKAIGLGLVVLLPLANPLTTVALFLGLAGNMNSAERNRQSLMASVYVFAIMMVAYYAGQLVMDTFGIISSASTVRQSSTFADWVLMVAPPLIFFLVAVILWGSLRSSGAIMRLVGKGGIEAISRLMGFLLVCMCVQFIINGILEIIKTYH